MKYLFKQTIAIVAVIAAISALTFFYKKESFGLGASENSNVKESMDNRKINAQYTSKLEFVTIPASENLVSFEMASTEVTNEQYKDYLNAAYKEGLVTMTPSREKYYTLGKYSDENMVFDVATGNPLIYLGGSRVIKDHNMDGEYEVHEMENPLNRSYIVFNEQIDEFEIVDPANVEWTRYFDPDLYPGAVDSISDWAELNNEKSGRFGHGDLDKSLPTKEEVANWPVTFVRYFGADSFARFYGYDIPTQAQWKWAAQAGLDYTMSTNDGQPGNAGASKDGETDFGADESKINAWFDAAEGEWFIGDPVPATHVQEVKRLAPNAYGLYSMGGNVWEWTSDWYQPDPSKPASPFFNKTGTIFVDGQNGRDPITLDDIRIDKNKPLEQNNQYMKVGIGGAHNFPSAVMAIDNINPTPFLAEANDHFGFRVVINSKSDQAKETNKGSVVGLSKPGSDEDSQSNRKKRSNLDFSLLDRDGNGISKDELSVIADKLPVSVDRVFKIFDKNKDGFLTENEMPTKRPN